MNIPPNDEVAGAIQTVAPHPTDPDILYIGAVNGGVWKTENATAGTPDWTPLTDRLPSQSIGAIQLDPTDATYQTLLVGTGRFSNFAGRGDDQVGLYRTTDGGSTWTHFDNANLQDERFTNVAARGNTLFAASDVGGVFRSTDTGATWTNISGTGGLPAGAAYDLVSDPGNNDRLYALVQGAGVFRTDNATALSPTWTDVSPGSGTVGSGSRMAVHDSGAGNVVYVAAVSGSLNGVFRSTNQGGAWTPLDVPNIHPGGQGVPNTSIAADPTDPDLVYLGGDRITTAPWTGVIVRIDASAGAGSQATNIVDGGAGNTTPHADSRWMAFDANGDLLEVDDGGIYRHSNPAGSGTWGSVIGDLEVFEAHDIAYDTLSNTLMAGMQDNGTFIQLSAGSRTWTQISGGDGGDVAIDDVTLAGSNQSYRYSSSQRLGHDNAGQGAGDFTRRTYDSANNPVGGSVAINTSVITDPQFVTPIELNTVNPSRMLFGGSSDLYESTNITSATPTITNIGGPGANRVAMVYGAVGNEDLIYVGKGSQVYARTVAGGSIDATAALPGGAGTITDVAIDPDDWRTVFAVDDDQVFMSTNAGTNWTDITGNLLSISSADFRALEFVPGAPNDAIIVGTRSGTFASPSSSFGTWGTYGLGMPDVLVFDLEYDAPDDLLVAGTLGRAAWTLPNASTEANQVTTISGNGGDNSIVVRTTSGGALVEIEVDGSVVNTLPNHSLGVLVVNGWGGNDTLTVDSSNGLIALFGGIRYDGGAGLDDLVLQQTGGDTQTSDRYEVGADIGSGKSTITGPSGTQVITFTGLEPVIDLVPAATLTVDGTNADNAVSYTQGSVAANGLVTIDNFESIEFSNKANLIVNGLAGDDVIHLNNSSTPTSLAAITVNGGDPTASDKVVVNGTSAGNTITVDQLTTDGARVTGALPVPVTVDTTELLVINGRAGSDLLDVVAPGQSGTLVSGPTEDAGTLHVGANLPVAFVEVEDARINGAPAIDLSWLPVPNAIVLDPTDDTGASSSDNVTSEAEARIFIEADLDDVADRGIDILTPSEIASTEPGVAVAVIVNGSRVGYATPIAGTNNTLYQYTFAPGDLSTTFIPVNGGGGLNFVKAAVVVFDGQGTSPVARTEESEPLLLTLDTAPPPAPAAPDLSPASDSGVAADDNITRVNAPALMGIAESNSLVRIYANGELVGQGVTGSDGTDGIPGNGLGRWEITVEPLADGSYSVTAEQEDLAGNIGPLSGPLVLTIDTTAPQIPTIDLINAYDSGMSDTDNITKGAAAPGVLNFRVTSDPGTLLQMKDGNAVIFGPFLTPASGEVIVALDFGALAGVTGFPAEGPHPLTVESLDTAGNVTQSEQLLVEVDTTAPVISLSIDLIESSDSYDNVTGLLGPLWTSSDNVTSLQAPAFAGTGEANALVRVFATNTQTLTEQLIGEGMVGSDATDLIWGNGRGAWEVTVEPLADGNYDITTEYIDLAGNVSGRTPALNVTIDTLPPQRPTLDLPAASDSGTSNTDNITNAPNDVPILVTAEQGSRVLIKNGETVIDDFIMPGASSTTRMLTLPEGTYLLSAEAFDVPGNRSAQSEQLLVEADRTAPAPTIPVLLSSSDSGSDMTDGVTAITQPAFRGIAEPGAVVRIQANGWIVGQGVANVDGRWEITVEPLIDGHYTIVTEVEDVAGNVSAQAVALIDVDAQAPNVPHLDLDPESDDGWHDDDNITSIGNPEVLITANDTVDGGPNPTPNDIIYRIYDRPGTVGADGEVLLFDSWLANGNNFVTGGFFTETLSQALNDPNGPPLAEGVHELKLVVEDRAGNRSESFLTLTIDPNAWDLSVARLANGQVILYDADADDPCCTDVDAFDVRITVNRDNVVTGVDIIGNPTGLGILVMPWGGGSVRLRDLRQLPPPMREDLSFLAIQGSASLVTSKMRIAGWENLGELILEPEGVVANADLDGDGNDDEATAFFSTGVVKKFVNWYGLGGDVVVRSADVQGRSIVRMEVWRGGVEGQAEVMTPDGGIGYFSASEGNFAGHMMTAGNVGTFLLTNGSVLTGVVDIGGSLNLGRLRSGASGGQVNVAAALGQFFSHQVFDTSMLTVGGNTNSARFYRGATDSVVTLNGDASFVGFGRGMTNTLVTVAGNTGLFQSLRTMMTASVVTLNGTARTVLIRGGIWDSSLVVVGRVAQADIYGAVGGVPGSGVSLGDAGRATFYGDVSADTMVTGDLTGRLKFERPTTGNVMINGGLPGKLFGRGFVDVEVLGDFLGRIGGKYTANGAGTLTLHVGQTLSGRVMRKPGGSVLVTGADPAFNGAFTDIVVI